MKTHTNAICRIDGHYLILKKKKVYTQQVFITFVLFCSSFFHQDDINLAAPFRDDTDLICLIVGEDLLQKLNWGIFG